MIIGIDFDNTIVCYDSVFLKIANDRGIDIPRGSDPKRALRNALQSLPEGEWQWSLVQGEVYGPGIMDAIPYDGLRRALEMLNESGHTLCVVSHKTAFPNAGEAHPLQTWALRWIERHLSDILEPGNIHLCHSKIEKIATISRLRCDCFIDDLEEILSDEQFPQNTRPILFKPGAGKTLNRTPGPIAMAVNWPGVLDLIAETPKRQVATPTQDSTRSATERIQACLGENAELAKSPLAGGRNSAVYLLSPEGSPDCVAKAYQRNPLDTRDRFRNETVFLEYAQTIKPNQTPQILSANPVEQCAFLEYIPGELAIASLQPATDWNACLDFYKRLQSNRASEQAKALPRAAEAAGSLQEHLDWISKRRAFWLKQALSLKIENQWKDWLLDTLEPAFQSFAKTLICHPAFKVPIDSDSFLISPSDFGLHNAIRKADGSLVFIDFEYGGWDDPAKTLSDFFLQPRLTPPESLFEAWKRAILERLPIDQRTAFEQRLPLVQSCCAMKWIFIILKNRLDPQTLQPKSQDAETALTLEKLETRLESIQLSQSDYRR